jgi:hypothetical protein
MNLSSSLVDSFPHLIQLNLIDFFIALVMGIVTVGVPVISLKFEFKFNRFTNVLGKIAE